MSREPPVNFLPRTRCRRFFPPNEEQRFARFVINMEPLIRYVPPNARVHLGPFPPRTGFVQEFTFSYSNDLDFERTAQLTVEILKGQVEYWTDLPVWSFRLVDSSGMDWHYHWNLQRTAILRRNLAVYVFSSGWILEYHPSIGDHVRVPYTVQVLTFRLTAYPMPRIDNPN